MDNRVVGMLMATALAGAMQLRRGMPRPTYRPFKERRRPRAARGTGIAHFMPSPPTHYHSIRRWKRYHAHNPA